MTPALAELEADLTALETLNRRRPLTLARAWHQPPPRTSQRAVLQLLPDTRELVVLGGQRSGKSLLLRLATVALVLGSDHPDAREFWESHDIDPDQFPPGPGKAWVIARTSSDSLRYHRKPYFALLPRWGPVHAMSKGTPSPLHAWNLMGRGESHIEIMVPGYDEPAEIHFKSEDQGPDSFDGDDIRVAHHDEEGKTGKIYDQVKSRLIDQDGWQLFSNAPIKGRTWVFHQFERDPGPGVVVRKLYTLDNPFLPPHRAKLIGDDPVKGRGEFTVSKGRIWPQFNRQTHVLPAEVRHLIPASAPRFRAIDFGTRHPHCCLWGAVLKSALALPDGRILPDKSLIVYRERYQAERTLAQHVEHYREVEGWVKGDDGRWTKGPNTERIAATWADPEDPQQVLSLNNDHHIEAMKANKAWKAGRDAVDEWMTPDATGYPRLFVLDCCPETIREVTDYAWLDTVGADGVAPEKPNGMSDHACDDLRYLVMGVRSYL